MADRSRKAISIYIGVGSLWAFACLGRWADAGDRGADAIPVEIAYEAPSDCPTEAQFLRQVHGRTERARSPQGPERPWKFRAVVVQRGERFSGRLAASNPEGQESSRDISGAECRDVAAALALIIALSVDPEASTKPIEIDLAASAPSVAPPVMSSAPAVPRVVPKRKVSPIPPAEPEGWGGTLGLTGGWTGNVAPGGGIGLGPFLQLVPRRMRSGWNPVFGVAVLAMLPRETRTDRGNGRFSWYNSRWTACAATIGVGASVSVFPCLTVDAGILAVMGKDAPQAESYARPWLSGGPSGALQWQTGGGLVVGLSGGLGIAAVRDTFYFRPSDTVFRAGTVGGWVSMQAGWRAW